MKSGTMNSDKHRGSTLLKAEENEQVFQLIGNRCQARAISTEIFTFERRDCHCNTTILT